MNPFKRATAEQYWGSKYIGNLQKKEEVSLLKKEAHKNHDLEPKFIRTQTSLEKKLKNHNQIGLNLPLKI